MMMLEDLRLALRQICQAIGIQGNAATVVSLIVLGSGVESHRVACGRVFRNWRTQLS